MANAVIFWRFSSSSVQPLRQSITSGSLFGFALKIPEHEVAHLATATSFILAVRMLFKRCPILGQVATRYTLDHKICASKTRCINRGE